METLINLSALLKLVLGLHIIIPRILFERPFASVAHAEVHEDNQDTTSEYVSCGTSSLLTGADSNRY